MVFAELTDDSYLLWYRDQSSYKREGAVLLSVSPAARRRLSLMHVLLRFRAGWSKNDWNGKISEQEGVVRE